MKTVIITCDDCGLSEGINLAALALHEKGMATAASLITNFPAVEHAFKLFAAVPSLECGAHLNLTEGEPLTRSDSLTGPDSRFRGRAAFWRRALLPDRAWLQAVEAE